MANQLSVAVVSPDKTAQKIITTALETRVETVWCLDTYPDPNQLKQLPQTSGGCLLFLDFSGRSSADQASAKAIAAAADASFRGITVVALYGEGKTQDLLELMRLGIREVIGLPPTAQEILQVLSRVSVRAPSQEQKAESRGRIVAFLPAKPGVGATTLAVHATAAAARISNRRTLLIDFDFRLGMTSFLLRLVGKHSVLDALELSKEMDQSQWEGLVNRLGMFDVLGSAPIEFHGADPEQGTGMLLEFVRRLYDSVSVDLPGEMRDYELDTLSRAQECFLICTPDLGAIHMAKRKVDMLRALNMDKRTSVIMNRSSERAFVPVKDIEAILQLPVRFSVANAEREIAAATNSASVLQGTAPVVTQIENIARHIAPAPTETPQPPRARKLIEFFSATSAREKEPDCMSAVKEPADPMLLRLGAEVRETLHNFMGLLELVTSEPLSDSQSQYLSHSRASADQLLGFANDLLELAQTEAPALVREAFCVEAAVGEIATLMGMLAETRGWKLTWDFEESRGSAPPAWAVGDRQLLQDTLRRLLDSAMEGAEGGEIHLSVAAKAEGDLVFEVTAPAGNSSGNQAGASADSAVGLNIVHKRARSLGGDFESSSANGVATLRLTAPFPEAPSPASAEKAAEFHGGAARNAPLNLLVAEDSDDSFFLLQAYLSSSGHRLTRANDGAEAVALAKSGHYDFVVMDVKMPAMDGYTASRLIREWETEQGRARMPILLLSADDAARQMRMGASVGCSGYLTKPATRAQVLEALEFYSRPGAK